MKAAVMKQIAPKIDIGIPEKDRRKIAQGPSQLLADTYTLYLKTHNFHWNVTGPMFTTICRHIRLNRFLCLLAITSSP